MKILCLVKFIPDVDAMELDDEKHVLLRENVKQIINPDDASALGFVLRLKKTHPELSVEVVAMAPPGCRPLAEDIARRDVEKMTMLTDPCFGGSDTLATSRILGAYLKQTSYDVIMTGTHTFDGDTAHVPAQLAELLDLPHMSGIMHVEPESFLAGQPLIDVDVENERITYQLTFPAILGICRESRYKLPFVRYANLHMDVADRLQMLDHEALGLSQEETGLSGSGTRVVRSYVRSYEKKQNCRVVKNDAEGIETVYQFLKEAGYLT